MVKHSHTERDTTSAPCTCWAQLPSCWRGWRAVASLLTSRCLHTQHNTHTHNNNTTYTHTHNTHTHTTTTKSPKKLTSQTSTHTRTHTHNNKITKK